MLWKIVYRRRWYPKHISKEDLMSGTDRGERDLYKDAVEKLIRNGWLQPYKAQGRDDVCIPKKHKDKALDILKSHQEEHDFIRGLEFVK